MARSVLVTAGPTREPLDPVRFLSNYSSGKMGVAIAAAAWRRGADVTLVAGPLAVPAPVGVTHVAVQSTAEMRDAVAARIGAADVLVMSAAPADYQPTSPAEGQAEEDRRALARSSCARRRTFSSARATRAVPGAIVVGFALETDDLLANAKRKLESKGLDIVVLNAANEPGAGFGVDTNRVTLVRRDRSEPEQLPLLDKRDVAEEILDRVEALLHGR